MAALPLDDPRWLPLKAALATRVQQTGSRRLAVTEFNQLLASGELRAMRRDTATGESWPLEPAYWRGNPMDADGDPGGFVFDRLAYFVWQPDLIGTAPTADQDDAAPPIKPGPKPRGDWPAVVAQWLIEVAADDPRRLQNVDELVTGAQNFLHNRIGWAPKETKELRAKIVELLRNVRS